MADKIKLALALALVGAGIAGFYIYSDLALVLRMLMVLGGVGAAAAVGWQTELGQRFVAFASEAVIEARKVVWPNRKETVQTTGIVFAFVVVIAIFLWLTDKSLEWVLYDLVLGWK
jgi:preprotein translocase subunit SecE